MKFKIYYSYPVDYEYDSGDIKKIKDYYGEIYGSDNIEVINPKDITKNISDDDLVKLKGDYPYFKEMMEKHFLCRVRDSDLLIWNDGDKGERVGEGVRIEFNEAIKWSVPIRYIRNLTTPLSGNRIIEFYNKNLKLKKELLDFFKVDSADDNGLGIEGLRAVAMRPYSKKRIYVYRNRWSAYGYALRTLEEGNFDEIVGYAKTIQYLPFIFDKDKITKNQNITGIRDCIIGIGYVIDIDMPHIDDSDATKGRLEMLTLDGIEYMKRVIGVFKDELNEVDEWNDCVLIFSGNGIQIKLEDFYGTKEKTEKFEEKMIELKRDVEHIIECHSHSNTSYGWNANMKPPSTFHFDNNLLSLYLDKTKKDFGLDLKYLLIYSNPWSKIYWK